MKEKDLVRSAIERGGKTADAMVRFRKTQLKKRAAVLAKASRTHAAAIKRVAAISPVLRKAAGPAGSTGALIAEGDSWFDCPLHDVLRMLEDDHGFDVHSLAHRGDRVESMAYADGQLEEFTRKLEKMIRNGEAPRAILLSGGGNDIAGTEFGLFLNHIASPIAGVNELIARGVIDQRIKFAFITIIAEITRICEKVLGRRVPVITHGYDYPVPDGRGFLGGFWFLPGPWLRPGFLDKGFEDTKDNIRLMKGLIDRFNDMLGRVASLDDFEHVNYIDLRGTLSAGADYKRFWANELHPSGRGFGLVADRFSAAIAKL